MHAHQLISRWLDKAAMATADNGEAAGPWSLCTVHQVEETKIVIRMIPIFITSALGYMPASVILTFTVQQGNTMDTLGLAPSTCPQLLRSSSSQQSFSWSHWWSTTGSSFRSCARRLGTYRWCHAPPAYRQFGIGFVAAMLATVAAAIVEIKRKQVAEASGLCTHLQPRFQCPSSGSCSSSSSLGLWMSPRSWGSLSSSTARLLPG